MEKPYEKRPVLVTALVLTAALLGGAPAVTRAAAPTRHAEGEVLNFSLLDYRGKHYELRRAPAKYVVLFFTGSDCPIARQCGPKLQAISREFEGKDVVVWLVN